MPRALLINPWIYDFAAFDLWACPLGLLNLAALMREGGWEVRFLDCLDRFHPAVMKLLPQSRSFNIGKYWATEVPKPPALKEVPRRFKRYGLPEESVREELLKADKPDIILITSRMTYWYPGVAHAIKLCREIFPGIPIVLGGTYATLCEEHAGAVCKPDFLYPGEGERQLTQIIESACGKSLRLPDDYNRKDLSVLDNLPFPAYDLLSNTRAIAMETSRGCPYNCTYCASKLIFLTYRRKSPQTVVDQIERAAGELGTQDIAFYDDALLLDHERHFDLIADGIVRRGITMRFHAPNSLFTNEITREVAEKMRAMGFKTIRVSLESSRMERLEKFNRHIGPSHFKKAMAHLLRAGFTPGEIGVYILAGLPEQTPKEVQEEIDYVIEHGGTPRVAEFSPIPGTREFQETVKKVKVSIANEPLLHNNSIFYMVSGVMKMPEMERLKQYGWKKIRGGQVNHETLD